MMIDYWNADEMLARWIGACHKENIGYLALLVCIAGNVSAQESLFTFAGIHWKPHRYRPRKGTVQLDTKKLKRAIKEKGLTQQEMSKLMGVSKIYMTRTFYEANERGYINKNRKFVEKCEKVLNLPKGSLIKKED